MHCLVPDRHSIGLTSHEFAATPQTHHRGDRHPNRMGPRAESRCTPNVLRFVYTFLGKSDGLGHLIQRS